MKIHYQCSNCGKRFVTSPIPGVPHGMYYSGCRAVGNAFYCEDCVKTWKDRNGEEFDKQISNPSKQFSDWWNRTVESQIAIESKLKMCKQLANGDYIECDFTEVSE